MSTASIPVDLYNPGQVMACLGFLEVTKVLLGQAEGGFNWRDETGARFELRTTGDTNPFEVVLAFLANAEIRRVAPLGYTDTPAKKATKHGVRPEEREEIVVQEPPESSETFPGPEGDSMALPIRLVGCVAEQQRSLDIGHWADASNRSSFKLYSGNRSAATIARAMLRGTRHRPKKGAREGAARTRGIVSLWMDSRQELIASPFDVLTPMGGSFNFDPRGAWTAIDAGYSPNDQEHAVAASPVVEMVAAAGLEHARPDEYDTREVRYGAWADLVPPILARPALAGHRIGIPLRVFRFTLHLSGKNKVVTFAEEEAGR